MSEIVGRLNRTIEARGPDPLWVESRDALVAAYGTIADLHERLASKETDLASRATVPDAEVAARQIDAPSVREAIGEVLADMEATAEGTHIASSLALLQEITDAAIRAAVSPPSRTAKRTGYETVGHGVGEHSQKITARAAVPDAATEELEAQLENAKAGWDSALRIANEGNALIKRRKAGPWLPVPGGEES